MKIFVLGKVSNITGWLPGCVAGLQMAGHTVEVGGTRPKKVSRAMDDALEPLRLREPLAERLARSVERFKPDLIIAILGYYIPIHILERLAASPNRPPVVGWVGDVFSERERGLSALYDLVGYTDTAMLELHKRLGFPSSAVYLPHAANPLLIPRRPSEREGGLVFVGTPTAHRRALLRPVRTRLEVYGTGWRGVEMGHHAVVARRIEGEELGHLYARSLASLNARNEENVVHGLNQRNFDPYGCGTPVVAEDQPDLARCFEPGKEVLAYRTVEELDEICSRLPRSPDEALRLGACGKARVTHEHTYAHRLQTLLRWI